MRLPPVNNPRIEIKSPVLPLSPQPINTSSPLLRNPPLKTLQHPSTVSLITLLPALLQPCIVGRMERHNLLLDHRQFANAGRTTLELGTVEQIVGGALGVDDDAGDIAETEVCDWAVDFGPFGEGRVGACGHLVKVACWEM